MTRHAEALAMCRTVCAHYGLSAEATELALVNAEAMPGRAAECYAAVLASLTVEQPRYRLRYNARLTGAEPVGGASELKR